MSKNMTKTKAKALKKEKAKRNTRRKTIIIMGIFAVIILAVALLGVRNVSRQNNGEVYSAAGQTVRLLDDGKFSAVLAHNTQKSGTYNKIIEDGRTAVIFNTNGSEEIGWIINNSLHIPDEWDDGHHHGSVLRRVGSQR